MAQKAGTFYLTLFLVVGTSVVSFAFDARYLAEEVSLKLRQNCSKNVFQLGTVHIVRTQFFGLF